MLCAIPFVPTRCHTYLPWPLGSDKRVVLEFGTFTSLLISALSGMGAYWVLALDPLVVRKDLGIVFITGLGGDSFLSNLIQRREAITQAEIANQYQQVVKTELSSDDVKD